MTLPIRPQKKSKPRRKDERRSTVQREAIRRAFDEEQEPLSPARILEHARAHAPSLGPATVYRTVAQLLEDGFIVPVELPGGSTLYERSGKHHHHHFSCTQCGRVFDIQGCAGQLDRLAPRGFRVDSHEVVLRGTCDTCNRRSGEKTRDALIREGARARSRT